MKKSNAVATGRKQTAPAPSATLPSAELAANQAPAPAPADPKAAGPREPERKQKRKPKPEPEARTEPEAAPLPTMPTVTELATLAATFAPFLATHTDLDDRARFGNSDIIRPALDLWLASREILAIAKNRKPTATEVVLAQIHANAVAVAAIQWPSPKDYPIDASKLAYLAVPKLRGKVKAQTEAIRGWLVWRERKRRKEANRYRPSHKQQPVDPTKAEVGQMLEVWNKRKLKEKEFRPLARSFARYYASGTRERLSIAGRKAVRTRWERHREIETKKK